MNIYIVYFFVQYMGEKTLILQSTEDDFKADKGSTLYKSANRTCFNYPHGKVVYKYYVQLANRTCFNYPHGKVVYKYYVQLGRGTIIMTIHCCAMQSMRHAARYPSQFAWKQVGV